MGFTLCNHTKTSRLEIGVEKEISKSIIRDYERRTKEVKYKLVEDLIYGLDGIFDNNNNQVDFYQFKALSR